MSQGITVQPGQIIERILTLELVRVTERAAVASARLRGRGNEKAADQAAVDAMRRELNKLPIDGTVVIGEGERDEAPMLFIGEKVGNKHGPKVDIAVDPLEGTTLCAKDMPGSIAVMAMAEAGTLLAAPDVYMHKIAVGPGYPAGVVDLEDLRVAVVGERSRQRVGLGPGAEQGDGRAAPAQPPAPRPGGQAGGQRGPRRRSLLEPTVLVEAILGGDAQRVDVTSRQRGDEQRGATDVEDGIRHRDGHRQRLA